MIIQSRPLIEPLKTVAALRHSLQGVLHGSLQGVCSDVSLPSLPGIFGRMGQEFMALAGCCRGERLTTILALKYFIYHLLNWDQTKF